MPKQRKMKIKPRIELNHITFLFVLQQHKSKFT